MAHVASERSANRAKPELWQRHKEGNILGEAISNVCSLMSLHVLFQGPPNQNQSDSYLPLFLTMAEKKKGRNDFIICLKYCSPLPHDAHAHLAPSVLVM